MVMLGSNTPAEVDALLAQSTTNHRMRTRLHLLDLDHNFIMDLSDLNVSDGAVTVSAGQSISRSMSLQLIDRTNMLGLSGEASAPTFLIQAWRGVYVDSLAQWVDLPVICAYVTKPSRTGDLLTIEGQDKGALGSFAATSLTLKKGKNVGTAIQEVMNLRAGETRFRLATTTAKLSRDFALDDQSTPWALAQEMGAEAQWDVFYDAEGYVVGRETSTSPVFTFTTGFGGTLASGIETGYWDGDLYNRVLIDGPVKSGKKITGEAVLPESHPLAPENLMRGGVLESGRRTFRETSKTLTSSAKAKDQATAKLLKLAQQQTTATYSSIPVWHLQEYDRVRAVDPITGIDVVAPWMTSTIPMTSSGVQTNGYTRRSLAGYTPRVSSTTTRKKKKR